MKKESEKNIDELFRLLDGHALLVHKVSLEKHHNKKVQKYAHLRQADVMWSRKIWREIDLRQKINHPFYYPENNGIPGAAVTDDRKSLIDVIYSAVLEGSITAYSNPVYDDEFRTVMTQLELKNPQNVDLIQNIIDPKL